MQLARGKLRHGYEWFEVFCFDVQDILTVLSMRNNAISEPSEAWYYSRLAQLRRLYMLGVLIHDDCAVSASQTGCIAMERCQYVSFE